MSTRARLVSLLMAVLVATALATGYVWHVRASDGSAPGGRIRLDATGRLLFRNTAPGAGFGRIATVPADHPGAARTLGRLRCDRVYAAHGTGVCLQRTGPVPGTELTALDPELRTLNRLRTGGFPNRARVSADGRMLSWTMFVRGDSYLRDDFSTRTGILDTRTGRAVPDIERIPLTLEGRPYHAADVNYWGVTFAADDSTFYATVRTGDRTYLVKGDYGKWTARTLRRNVECPSLSPDGRRLVFKKRVRGSEQRPWRLHVLDLATMKETPLAEPRSVDDQAAWLDGRTVMYGLPRHGGGWDVWSVPADGSGRARVLVHDANSPALLTH